MQRDVVSQMPEQVTTHVNRTLPQSAFDFEDGPEPNAELIMQEEAEAKGEEYPKRGFSASKESQKSSGKKKRKL
jgi:hypothetical protein